MQQFPIGLPVIIIVIIILYILASSIRILREYERGVIFRLGRVLDGGVKGPGLILLIPIIDKMVKVSLRIVVMDVPPQDVITQDNVSIKVNAVIYFRVIDPQKAVIEIENYLAGTSQLSQTTLRSVLGQSELDDLLSQRDKINIRLQHIIDEQTEPWGVKVTHVEVKQIDLPQEMQRAMARQAEAERERRAKVIAAEGEFQASQKLSDAAKILGEQPSALTLRYLQTLREIGTENNTTTLFPLPLDLLRPFIKTGDNNGEGPAFPAPTVTVDK
jgi:regulator of protease activity HflC (stomatin/prohibitin superfamily)